MRGRSHDEVTAEGRRTSDGTFPLPHRRAYGLADADRSPPIRAPVRPRCPAPVHAPRRRPTRHVLSDPRKGLCPVAAPPSTVGGDW
jgi:hypothetical protein